MAFATLAIVTLKQLLITFMHDLPIQLVLQAYCHNYAFSYDFLILITDFAQCT